VAFVVDGVRTIATSPPPVAYERDPATGASWPVGVPRPMAGAVGPKSRPDS
jgi:hypothetical protein